MSLDVIFIISTFLAGIITGYGLHGLIPKSAQDPQRKDTEPHIVFNEMKGRAEFSD